MLNSYIARTYSFYEVNRILLTILLGIFSTMLFVLAFYQALYSGFTLIDDSTINASVLRWINDDESFWSILYRPEVQSGARYTPTFWTIKAIIHLAFGYKPEYHHAFHLLMVWVPIILLPFLIALRFNCPIFTALPLPYFILSSGNDWSQNLWNVYDVSTFDPYAGAFMAFTCICFERILKHKDLASPRTRLWLLLFSISNLLLVHSKETVAVGTLGCSVILLISSFLFKNHRKILITTSIISFSCVFFFFIGFFVSGAFDASKNDEYTSNFQVNPKIILSNILLVTKLLVKELGWIIPLCGLVITARFVFLYRNRKTCKLSSLDFLMITSLVIFCSFCAAVLPISNLGQLPRLLYLSYIGLSFSISITIVSLPGWIFEFSILNSNKIKMYSSTSILFLMLIPLLLAFPKAMSYGNFYRGVLGGEWNAVNWMSKNLSGNEESGIFAVVAPDSESFYWGLCIHLKNQGIEPYSQTQLINMSDLRMYNSNLPILILSRSDQYKYLVESGMYVDRVSYIDEERMSNILIIEP